MTRDLEQLNKILFDCRKSRYITYYRCNYDDWSPMHYCHNKEEAIHEAIEDCKRLPSTFYYRGPEYKIVEDVEIEDGDLSVKAERVVWSKRFD